MKKSYKITSYKKQKIIQVLNFLGNPILQLHTSTMKFFILLIFLIFFKFCVTKTYFDIQLDRMELIFQNDSIVDYSKLRVRKVNGTRSLVGEYTNKVPIGDDFLIETKFYKKQGGEYRLQPYRLLKTPYCKFVAEDCELKEFNLFYN